MPFQKAGFVRIFREYLPNGPALGAKASNDGLEKTESSTRNRIADDSSAARLRSRVR